ncbi:hypothetical protein L1049_006420 [Liquidambar formosana]|uniref:Uncharacterized protein n=1 Tax=Liquidambar formosana TaxID=63359 RepID=A0AAP0RHA6_LIQFO
MYVTRPLSLYRKFPAALSEPPEGPNSGYLVVQDEESEITCCFGLCKDREIWDLPIPQNKNLTIRYSSGVGKNERVSRDRVILIPVLNQPLSSNRYYAIKRRGWHKGEAHTNSKEEDMGTCCFCNFVQDVNTRPLDPRDTYQQFEISHYEKPFGFGLRSSYVAKSVAPDGFPPYFMRRKGWQLYASTPSNYELGEAPGLNTALRARLPEFDFPLSYKSSEPVVVGKWYCPFMFVKEGKLKDQMKISTYYEMTLEQRWEQIFAYDNNYKEGNAVAVDVLVQREVVSVAGREANIIISSVKTQYRLCSALFCSSLSFWGFKFCYALSSPALTCKVIRENTHSKTPNFCSLSTICKVWWKMVCDPQDCVGPGFQSLVAPVTTKKE